MRKREILAEINEELLLLDPPEFDQALIGTAEGAGWGPVAAYDVDKCIEVIMENGDMTREEATEFFHFNTLSAFVGEQTPVFITRIDDEAAA